MAHPLITALEKGFLENFNESIAAKQTAYLKDQFSFLGISQPQRRSIEQVIFKAHPLKSEDELLDVLAQLWEKDPRELQYSALSLARRSKKLWTEKSFETFERMIRRKSWWDTVDDISANLIGKLLHERSDLVTMMDVWIEDSDLWIKRTAILFQLRWKEDTNAQRLFAYCEKTAAEKNFFIRKAIGWSLREYSKTDPQAVQVFLNKNQKYLSALSFKEAKKHLL